MNSSLRVTTLPAHRLLGLAAREGDAGAVGEALFRAHFAEGRNLADPATLVEAGAAGGLAAERIRACLDSDEGLAEVRVKGDAADAPQVRLGEDGRVTACWVPVAAPTFQVWGAWLLVKRDDDAEAKFSSALADYPDLAERVQKGTFAVLWPAALVSLFCFLLNLGLLRYLYRMERERS